MSQDEALDSSDLFRQDEAMADANLERLGDYVVARRTALGMRDRRAFAAATGITDGELLQGVRYHDFGATTQSLVMRSRSGTVRFVSARHPLDKLREFSQIEFG